MHALSFQKLSLKSSPIPTLGASQICFQVTFFCSDQYSGNLSKALDSAARRSARIFWRGDAPEHSGLLQPFADHAAAGTFVGAGARAT